MNIEINKKRYNKTCFLLNRVFQIKESDKNEPKIIKEAFIGQHTIEGTECNPFKKKTEVSKFGIPKPNPKHSDFQSNLDLVMMIDKPEKITAEKNNKAKNWLSGINEIL